MRVRTYQHRKTSSADTVTARIHNGTYQLPASGGGRRLRVSSRRSARTSLMFSTSTSSLWLLQSWSSAIYTQRCRTAKDSQPMQPLRIYETGTHHVSKASPGVERAPHSSARATEADSFARAERRQTGLSACPECLGWACLELKRETQRETRRPGRTRGIIRPVSEPARVAPHPLLRVFPPGGAQKVPARTTRSRHACADTPLG